MITLQTRGRRLRAYSDEKLVTGSFGITAKLITDSEWDGVEPTVTFKVGRSEFVAELNADGTYDVPFDLFSSESRYRTLLAAVYGKKNGEVVISTTYTPIGEIIDGSSQTTNSGNIQKLFTLYNDVKQDVDGVVRSVNGSNPDENGDVQIKIEDPVRSDLSVNDESDPAYVQGVIRQESLPDGYPYEVETDRYTVIDASDISWRTSMGYSATVSPADNFISFSAGNEYIIETNGYSKRVTCTNDGRIYSSYIDIASRTDSQDYYLYSSNESYDTVKVVAVAYNLTKLDERFIPSYVAKVPYASVDQVVAVKTTNDYGVPTEWKAVNIPSSIVSTVNGVTPDSKGNVTLDVCTKDELATVATSGQYQDLEGIPVSKIISELKRYYSLNSTITKNGNTFHYTSTFNSSEFGNIYKDKMLSFSFRKSPAYGSVEFLKTDYQYPKITESKFNIWGNCSLYSSSYEDTGETWCVYISIDYIYAFSSDNSVYNIYVYYTETEIKQLSEEFIPSSIARITDVNELIEAALGVIENGTY